MTQIITKRGLRNYCGEIVSFHRGDFSLEGKLLFGDIRDKGIVEDHYRKDKDDVFYVVGPTKDSLTHRGISKIGTRSRQYDAWNVPLKTGDIINIRTSDCVERHYKINL